MIVEIINLLSVLAAIASYNIFIMAIARRIQSSPNIVSTNEYLLSILFNVAMCCSLVFSILQICVGKGTLFASNIRGFFCNIAFVFSHVLAAMWGWAFSSGNNMLSVCLMAGMCLMGLISYLTTISSRIPLNRSHLKRFSPRGIFLFKHLLCTGMVGAMWSWSVFALQLSVSTLLQSTRPPNCTNSTVLAVVPPALVACVCILSGDFVSILIPCVFVAIQFITTRPTTISCSDKIDTSYLSCLFVLGFELLATIISMVGRGKRKEGKKSLNKVGISSSAINGKGVIDDANIDLNNIGGMMGAPLTNTLKIDGMGIDHTLKLPDVDGVDVFDKYKSNINQGDYEEDEYEWEEEYEEDGEYEYEEVYEEEYEDEEEKEDYDPAPKVIREVINVSAKGDGNVRNMEYAERNDVNECRVPIVQRPDESFDESVIEVAPVCHGNDVPSVLSNTTKAL